MEIVFGQLPIRQKLLDVDQDQKVLFCKALI